MEAWGAIGMAAWVCAEAIFLLEATEERCLKWLYEAIELAGYRI
jgi:hypothetical protein